MNFNVTSIGRAAWQVWSHDQPATVIGVTSRGLFIRAADRVIFVSFETWRGPLTITLDRSIDQLRTLNPGDTAVFSHRRLIFPAIAISVSAAADNVWQAPLAVASTNPIDQPWKTAQHITRSVTTRKPDRGFSPLLSHLLDLPPSGPLPADQATLLAVLQSLRQALRSNYLPHTLNSIDDLLGRGSGLTPSGDDCVLGLLLMLNRWQTNEDWRELNRAVINAAYQKTTTISANLIECATAGQADERLINVVDGIVTGVPSIDLCVDCVLDWGSSSGIDALVGMAIAL